MPIPDLRLAILVLLPLFLGVAPLPAAALTAEQIDGAPEPSKVSKTNSHGCVRLTNWDAEELAELVRPGVPVRFLD